MNVAIGEAQDKSCGTEGETMTLWSGRFSQKLDDLAWALNASLPVDQRMAIQDVDGSLAWADALHKANIRIFSITWGRARWSQTEFISRLRNQFGQRRDGASSGNPVTHIGIETHIQFSGGLSQGHESIPGMPARFCTRAETDIPLTHSASAPQL